MVTGMVLQVEEHILKFVRRNLVVPLRQLLVDELLNLLDLILGAADLVVPLLVALELRFDDEVEHQLLDVLLALVEAHFAHDAYPLLIKIFVVRYQLGVRLHRLLLQNLQVVSRDPLLDHPPLFGCCFENLGVPPHVSHSLLVVVVFIRRLVLQLHLLGFLLFVMGLLLRFVQLLLLRVRGN